MFYLLHTHLENGGACLVQGQRRVPLNICIIGNGSLFFIFFFGGTKNIKLLVTPAQFFGQTSTFIFALVWLRVPVVSVTMCMFLSCE